jgi:hypothetical protein
MRAVDLAVCAAQKAILVEEFDSVSLVGSPAKPLTPAVGRRHPRD